MLLHAEKIEDKCIGDYLAHYAETCPNKEAIGNAEVSYSYCELLNQVEICAGSLYANGIRKGDRVATLSPPHPDYVIILLATAAIGGIWLGLNPRYTRDELAHVISDSNPSLIFARTQIGDRQYHGDLNYFQENVSSIKSIITLGKDEVIQPFTPYNDFIKNSITECKFDIKDVRKDISSTDAVLLVYTSGTTGKPKGAILNHYGAIRHAHVQQLLGSPGEVRLINAFPINHIGGILANSIYCLVTGGTCFFLEKFDPGEILRITEEKQITGWSGVPTMLQSILDHPDYGKADLSSVSGISYSGGSSSKHLLERLSNEVCPAINTMYALTEASGVVTAVPSTNDIDLLAESVGTPISDCELRLVDESGNDVSRGKTGEILIKGPFIMNGYWGLPDATKAAIDTDGWLHTKDLAFERDDGNIVLVGRLSDMYKSGGYNVYPREIEQVLESHPAVNLACVVGVSDPTYQEVGYAFVTLTIGQTLNKQELDTHCRQSLANYKVPKYFQIESELPVLPNNKPDKRKLREKAIPAIQEKSL